ncbi:YicC family protein [bacterium]|nr:YicC family protein [bacterium]
MLYSMTGYGKTLIENSSYSASIAVKTVNSRFREIKVNLPPYLYEYEEPIMELIKNRIKRGKINLYIDLEVHRHTELFQPQADTELAKSYIEMMDSIAQEKGIQYSLSLSDVFSLPEVLKIRPLKSKMKEISGKVLKGVEKALDNLDDTRIKEGNYIEKDLRARLDIIQKSLDKIDSNLQAEKENRYNYLKGELAALLKDNNINEDRLFQEVALLAQKGDYTEEIVRTRSHLEQLYNALNSDIPVGSKLSYILQELLRESNTIAAKASNIDTARIIIQIKEEYERIREQIRNIE